VNQTFADRYRATVGMLAWMLMRWSGIILVLYTLAYIFFLRSARQGAAAFDQVMARFQSPFWQVIHIVILALLLFHLFNGIRVLMFDSGYGLNKQRALFWLAMTLTIALTTLYAVLTFAYGGGF
jgi:succinate dehydrogenase / fumarate reductase, cytochrome b subunit